MKTSSGLLIGGGLLIAGLAYGAWRKTQELSAIFEKMTIGPNSLPKRLKLNAQALTFEIDIIFTNPTRADFSLSGYLVTLKRVMVYYKGQLLGIAAVEITDLEVPNYNTLVLRNVRIAIPYNTILTNAESIMSQLTDLKIISQLSFVGVVEALGVEYEIG